MATRSAGSSGTRKTREPTAQTASSPSATRWLMWTRSSHTAGRVRIRSPVASSRTRPSGASTGAAASRPPPAARRLWPNTARRIAMRPVSEGRISIRGWSRVQRTAPVSAATAWRLPRWLTTRTRSPSTAGGGVPSSRSTLPNRLVSSWPLARKRVHRRRPLWRSSAASDRSMVPTASYTGRNTRPPATVGGAAASIRGSRRSSGPSQGTSIFHSRAPVSASKAWSRRAGRARRMGIRL